MSIVTNNSTATILEFFIRDKIVYQSFTFENITYYMKFKDGKETFLTKEEFLTFKTL
jgi:hypothetical protein